MISWEDFHGICKALALAVGRFAPEVIVAVGRGGFYPGTLLAHMLRVEIVPVHLSRRVTDIVTYEQPQWVLEPPQVAVAGKRVLVVDEISSTGATLGLVVERIRSCAAAEVRSATLYAHSWGAHAADYVGVISDALIVNPWDREVLSGERFVIHPEYLDALTPHQSPPDKSFRVPAPAYTLARRPE